ncbi:hypothetical protein VNI00_012693 [Paramarasmius palmivorus]|uniref:Uncharacterized protein n=1 Tax=Paramarasmius palmivorus TaxID=297713 RepID=A0AAW0C2Y5_9AGAR
MAYDILVGKPTERVLDYDKKLELNRLAKKARIETVMQVHLDVFSDSEWDALRKIFVETDAVVSGTTVTGCLTTPDDDSPFQIFVGQQYTALILDFVDSTEFTFDSNLPAHMRLDDPSDTMWLDFQHSNTLFANKSPHTPTVDDDTYVANVFNFTGPNKRKIQVVSGNISSVQLVLAMKSTMHMNMITAWDLVMAYPQLTLDRREALDTDNRQGAEITDMSPFFDADGILVNPMLTAYDVAVPGSEVTVLPRHFGDEFTLRIALPAIPLPYGDALPGSRASLYSNSWQLRFGPKEHDRRNLMSVESTVFRHSFVSKSIMLSPTVESVVLQKLPLEWRNAVTGHAAISRPDEEIFFALLREAYEEISAPDSPYFLLCGRIATEFRKWNSSWCKVGRKRVPPAGVAYCSFRTLSNLEAGLDGSAQV